MYLSLERGSDWILVWFIEEVLRHVWEFLFSAQPAEHVNTLARPCFLGGKLLSSSVLNWRKYHSSFITVLTLFPPSSSPILPSCKVVGVIPSDKESWCLGSTDLKLYEQCTKCKTNVTTDKVSQKGFVFSCNPLSVEQLDMILDHNYVVHNF